MEVNEVKCVSNVVISKKGKKSYHDEWCPYVKQTKKENRKRIPEELAIQRGYCECKFCRSVRGIVYKYRLTTDIDISYDKVDDAACVRTPVGFWKLMWRDDRYEWDLFHMNKRGYKSFNNTLPSKTLMRGSFHRQGHFFPTSSFSKAIKYILSHDKNYEFAEKHGINKMPKSNQQQRLHYRQQKNRKRKESIHNVYKIFNELERGNKK